MKNSLKFAASGAVLVSMLGLGAVAANGSAKETPRKRHTIILPGHRHLQPTPTIRNAMTSGNSMTQPISAS
jgi:hypothetical protein